MFYDISKRTIFWVSN